MLKNLKTTIAGVTAAAMVAASSIVAVPTASAATLIQPSAASSASYNDGPVELVRHRSWHHRKNLRSHRDHRRYYRSHRRSNFPAAMFGFAMGAMVGSAMSQPQYRGSNWDAYCSSKYRSYKPWTGTYTTYDGREVPCR